jgi:hypothetical protein
MLDDSDDIGPGKPTFSSGSLFGLDKDPGAVSEFTVNVLLAFRSNRYYLEILCSSGNEQMDSDCDLIGYPSQCSGTSPTPRLVCVLWGHSFSSRALMTISISFNHHGLGYVPFWPYHVPQFRTVTSLHNTLKARNMIMIRLSRTLIK